MRGDTRDAERLDVEFLAGTVFPHLCLFPSLILLPSAPAQGCIQPPLPVKNNFDHMLFQAIFILFFNKSIKMETMGFVVVLFCFPELGDREGGASVEVWFIITLLLESVSPSPQAQSPYSC